MTLRWLFWMQIGVLAILGVWLFITEVIAVERLDPTLDNKETNEM